MLPEPLKSAVRSRAPKLCPFRLGSTACICTHHNVRRRPRSRHAPEGTYAGYGSCKKLTKHAFAGTSSPMAAVSCPATTSNRCSLKCGTTCAHQGSTVDLCTTRSPCCMRGEACLDAVGAGPGAGLAEPCRASQTRAHGDCGGSRQVQAAGGPPSGSCAVVQVGPRPRGVQPWRIAREAGGSAAHPAVGASPCAPRLAWRGGQLCPRLPWLVSGSAHTAAQAQLQKHRVRHARQCCHGADVCRGEPGCALDQATAVSGVSCLPGNCCCSGSIVRHCMVK